MTPLVIIPARFGSVRVPRKNFKPIANGPSLVERAYAIGQQIGECLIATDASYAAPLGATIWRRLKREARGTPLELVRLVTDIVAAYPEYDPIVLLQPTQPLRTLAHVQRGLAALTEDVTAVVSIVGFDDTYRRDGTFYILWRQTLREFGDFYGNRTVYFRIPMGHSVNIDTPADWDRAETALRKTT